MKYLELTRLDGSTILINKNSIVAVYYDEIKSHLMFN